MTIGHCKHGEFELMEGCKLCIEERRTADLAEQVKKKSADEETLEQLDIEEDMNSEDLSHLVGAGEVTETALVLCPGEDVEVHGYYEESVKLLEYAEKRVIASLEDNKDANDDLSIISKLKKAMEAKKREYLEPLKVQQDAIRDTYNFLMTPIIEAEKLTKSKMLSYDAEQQRIRAEQEDINRKRLEAAEAEMKLKGELTESVNLVEVAPEAPKRTQTDLGTSGQRDVWKFEIVDLDALPREYMIPDLVMLNAIAKKYHDQKKIAGVRFYCEKIMAVRAR